MYKSYYYITLLFNSPETVAINTLDPHHHHPPNQLPHILIIFLFREKAIN